MSEERDETKGREDPRSTDDLIKLALGTEDEDERWKIVTILHFRATDEVFDAARCLCSSTAPGERGLGADILGQLGIPERKFLPASVRLLLDLVSREEDWSVLTSAMIALGHNSGSFREWHEATALKNHPDADVRQAVAFALSTVAETDAVRTLIELSGDDDENVRNWATFGLGSLLTEVDTSELRDALLLRLTDPGDEVRAEALIGLAYRKDARVVEPLIKELSDQLSRDVWYDHTVEAAQEMPDPRMYPYLIELRSRDMSDYKREELEAAIAACQCAEQGNP